MTVPDSWDSVQLAPLYDVHIGHDEHDAEMFSRHLRWLRETPNVLTFNGGDLIENASKLSVGNGVYQQLKPQHQLVRALLQLAGVAHKMLFALPGNHEDRTEILGFSVAAWMAALLQVPYFPDYCLAADTKVLRGDLTWQRIGDIEPGDSLLAFDEMPVGPNRGRRWRPAVALTTRRLMRPCYEIVLTDGTAIVASGEHRWLTSRGEGSHYVWAQTQDLRPGRHLVRVLRTWARKNDYGTGYLEAAFDGEGCVRQSAKPYNESYANGVAFTQKPNAMLERVRHLLTARGLPYREHARKSDGIVALELSGMAATLEFLGSVAPQRLLARFQLEKLGRMTRTGNAEIHSIRPIGMREVVALTTSTGTFVAEGLASHNCFCTIKWRGNNFRLLAHHGTGAAQTAGGQRMAARKDIGWAHNFDLLWTGHLHSPLIDMMYQTGFDASGRAYERNGLIIISPSYLKYHGTYAAKKRYPPSSRGLVVVTLRPDGRMDANLHANGRRL